MKLTYHYLYILFIFLSACSSDDDTTDKVVETPKTIEVDGRNWTYNPSNFEIEYPAHFPPLDSAILTEEVFQLGRHLFYETKLSRNSTVSCSSCHKQEKAFTDGRQFSVGLNGKQTPRNSMSLANLAWENVFFWDLRSPSLEDQSLLPIQDHIEMDFTLPEVIDRLDSMILYDSLFFHAYGDTMKTPQKIARAISTFERALVSKDSKFDKFKRGELQLDPKEKMGMDLMRHPDEYWNSEFQTNVYLRGGNCGDCHGGSLFNFNARGNKRAVNNGLDFDNEMADDGLFKTSGRSEDKGKFKITTLRNIALTAPYMHDGRFNTLEEVLDHYNEHVKISSTLDDELYINNDPDELYTYNQDSTGLLLGLMPEEKAAIIAFLNTLTDEEFTSNPRYSNPFEN